MRGVALYGNVEQIRALANRNDVERISIIEDMAPQNSGTLIDTDTLSVGAKSPANPASTGYTGKGVKIVVLDTGIDYTHADLGGPGTQEAFERLRYPTRFPRVPTIRRSSSAATTWSVTITTPPEGNLHSPPG